MGCPGTKTQTPQRQERGEGFGRTTVECELELHQAHSLAMLRRALRRNIDIRGAVTRHLDARAPKPTPLPLAKRSPFSSVVASPLRSPQPLRSANRLSSRSVPATPLRSSRIDPDPVTPIPLRVRNPPPVRGSLECSQIALHRRPSPQLVCKSPFATDRRVNSDVRKSPFSAGYRSESAICLPYVARSNVHKSPFTADCMP